MTQPRWERTGLRLLVVDDDMLDRKSIRRALVAGGVDAEIVEASDAEHGLELLASEPVDAVLLDFDMPRRDGLWLVREARRRGVRCPLIVLTGQGDEQIAVELMKAGATDYVAKATITPERAVQSLRHALRVTEVERALRESEERAQLAVEALQLGTWDLEPTSGKLRLSDRCRALLCISPDEEATYERLLESVHPADAERTRGAVERALQPASGGGYDMEFRVLSPCGSLERWLRATGKVFFNEAGRPLRFIGTVQDIDEQKQLEAQRARLFEAERSAREQAEAASRMREDLVAIVSHDLRNPLSSISMSAEVLQAIVSSDASPQLRRPLETIVRSVGRMKRLISDLLDVASIDAGGLSVHKEPHEATVLMREAIEMMLPIAVEKSLLLEFEPTAVMFQVAVDKERILQVFSNLIGNAIKFTREGGRIGLGVTTKCADFVEFRVTDTGQGVSEEHLTHIFDRYWQAHQEGRMGIGLGLSIVKGIIEVHQGEIRAESTLGKGTTFYFTLPRVNDGGCVELPVCSLSG